MCLMSFCLFFFFFSSRRRHTRWPRDWSSDVCSSDLMLESLIQEVRESASPVRAAAAARAFVALVTVHHEKDAEILAPALAADSEIEFAEGLQNLADKIGRASCRERVEISVVCGFVK